MKTAHKIRMNPTAEQVDYLKRACGTRRFIYNWGREHWEAEYQAYKLEQETVPEAERTDPASQRDGPQKTVQRASGNGLSLELQRDEVRGGGSL
jgi:transposase